MSVLPLRSEVTRADVNARAAMLSSRLSALALEVIAEGRDLYAAHMTAGEILDELATLADDENLLEDRGQ